MWDGQLFEESCSRVDAMSAEVRLRVRVRVPCRVGAMGPEARHDKMS